MKNRKILPLKSQFVVSKNDDLSLGSNYAQIDDLKYKIENTKAIYEIRKIIEGKPFSMNDVWREVLDDELLYQETKR